MSCIGKVNGHYFFNDSERAGSTCNVVFTKGPKAENLYCSESMCLTDDLFSFSDIERLFAEAISDFNMYTDGNEINIESWNMIKSQGSRYSKTTQVVVNEMDSWMTAAINEHGCVTVVGV